MMEPNKGFPDTVWERLAVILGCGVLFILAQESAKYRSDYEIWHDIRLLYSSDVRLDRVPIWLQVNQGQVELSGAVTDPRVRSIAIELADSVVGVVKVEDHLAVQSKLPLLPPGGLAGQAASDRDESLARVAEIAEQTQLEPWYGPDDSVTVRVDDGRIVLEGQVGTLQEKARLNTIAFQTGVAFVDNRVQSRLGYEDGELPYIAQFSTPFYRQADYRDRYPIDPAGNQAGRAGE